MVVRNEKNNHYFKVTAANFFQKKDGKSVRKSVKDKRKTLTFIAH